MNKPTNQPWQLEFDKEFETMFDGYERELTDLDKNKVKQFISELLQREKEESCKVGYNYARKEMKQWAEEKVGENHEKLMIELLEELK